jgi:hypothetical protein
LARVDVSILKEIARVVQTRGKVPDRIHLQKRTFSITYLEDHRQRIEEALRRHDPDRLNMLFGQLESKVKYQVVRRGAAAAAKKKARTAGATQRRESATRAKPKSRPRPAMPKRTSTASSRTTPKKKVPKAAKAAPRRTAAKSQARRKRTR